MRRVMKPAEFRRWFHRFLPQLSVRQPKGAAPPAIVTDRTDPKLVHLDGLNLSRAWCMRSIASCAARKRSGPKDAGQLRATACQRCAGPRGQRRLRR